MIYLFPLFSVVFFLFYFFFIVMVSESEHEGCGAEDIDIQRPDASSVSGVLQLSAIERAPPYLHLLQVGGQDSRPAAGKRGYGPSRSHGHRGRRGRGG